MIAWTWAKAKWAERKIKRKEKRERKQLERIRNKCVYCRLWREGISYKDTINSAAFMPAMVVMICPCMLHGTQEEKELYKEMYQRNEIF